MISLFVFTYLELVKYLVIFPKWTQNPPELHLQGQAIRKGGQWAASVQFLPHPHLHLLCINTADSLSIL